MRRLSWIIFIALLPIFSAAKSNITDSMNTELFWKNIVFRDYKAERAGHKKIALPKADTMFIVASNRQTRFGETRFMGEERGTDHLNYFLVFLKNGKWHVWHTSLRTAMNVMQPNNRDWVVYTEGFGKIFTTGIYRGLNMTAQYGVNVIYLDYPSFNTSKRMMGNYYFAMDNAKQSGDDFAPLLDTLKTFHDEGRMGAGHITLFFHSMGNNMIREMVRNNRIDGINDSKWIDNLVLNSACVPQKNHREWVDEIRFASRIYINYNPKDATLSGANFMSLKKQLGQRQKEQRSGRAIYVNFDALCNRNHSNFMHMIAHKPVVPAAANYYATLFHGDYVTLDNGKCFKANATNRADYTILDALPDGAQTEVSQIEKEVQEQKQHQSPAGSPAQNVNVRDVKTRGGSNSSMLH